jgi:hypothetical protein
MAMKYRFVFLTGAALGYVLGTHAGRERYEQIKRLSRRVAENPTVQEAAGVLRAQAGELAGTARQKVGHQVSGKVPGMRRFRQRADVT